MKYYAVTKKKMIVFATNRARKIGLPKIKKKMMLNSYLASYIKIS